MAKPRASEMVDFVCRKLVEDNFELVKDTCDMNWKHEWQRKRMIYKIFLHMANMVWETYKSYDKRYNKGI